MNGPMSSTQNKTNVSRAFAIVQQLSSYINKDRLREIVDKAKGLDIGDNQLAVDLLYIALEKSHHLLKNPDRILLLLTELALSAKVLARNRTINFEYIASDVESPDVYRLLGEPPAHVKVVRRGKMDIAEVFNERLITWAHLSHASIFPIYGAFLEGDGGPVSLISPCTTQRNIVDYAKTLSQTARMPLISDLIEGLCYLHGLSVVHGALSPQNVLISHEGRALITGLDSSSESQGFELSSVRYSSPEMMDEDDAHPKTGSDMWSLGCVIYEVLSGKVPFYQIRQEGKVGAAVVAGKKPLRPSQAVSGMEEIGDAIWGPISTCWESEAEDRPSCLQFQKDMAFHDHRSAVIPTIQFPEHKKDFAINLDLARSILTQIIGSDLSLPPPSQIPEHLQKPLSGLADNETKAETVAVAAKKLSPDDTQILVDVLDLVWQESPTARITEGPIDTLLNKIMMSTHIFPQRYKIKRVPYDPTPIAEGHFGKMYKGRDLDVCVSVVTRPNDVSETIEYLSVWTHTSHPNVLPLYGVFHEGANETPRLCIVSPYMKNGLLRNFAPRLPQKDRVPLILDIVDALLFLQRLDIVYEDVRGDRFLISDEGRAMIDGLGPPGVLTSPTNIGAVRTSEPYALRFHSPEQAKKNETSDEGDVWSFGCLLYEVLSRKPPYHQYTKASRIRSALSRGETPKRPSATDDDIDEINDQFWDLIMGCCVREPEDRLTLSEIKKVLADMEIQDDRPETTSLPGAEALTLRSAPDINWDGVKPLIDQIQIELLRTPLSQLIKNHTKEVAAAAAQLKPEDTRTLVEFLDLALKNHITLSDERNRVLALLSRTTTLTRIFPRRYELNGIKYHSSPIAGGGFGTVHRGVSDPNICVKVVTKVESSALTGFIKELMLWAHLSHPNILSFYGVFINESKHICLVAPFMNKGNLHDYAPRLAPKKRVPLLYDVIKGLKYLHGLGIVHTDLKGENVLISDEGRGLITDFGASHVITATAKGGATTASVASTLRFSAPEIILDRHARPTQECDIWSFGCLCYEVLSRKLPYYEYKLEAQVVAALARRQLPKRPSASNNDDDTDSEDLDEFDEPDEIDDPTWSLITHCCARKPEDRPNASRIQELIVDLKMWDNRSEAKDTNDTLLSLRSNPDVDLNRAGELLNELQVWFLAHSALRYPPEDVIAAVKKLTLRDNDASALVEFWDLVLKGHLFTSDESNRALALLSSLMYSTGFIPWRYILPNTIQYRREVIGSGSFGAVHRGSDPNSNLCVKVTNFSKIGFDLTAQKNKTLAPSVYSSHPNILPFYGTYLGEGSHESTSFLVFPFIRNGNLHDYAHRLPQKSQILVIRDVIEAVIHLHSLGIVHGNLKGENILISDEGRALVADFRPYHINIAAAKRGLTGSYVTSTLRFTAPELVRNGQMLPTTRSDTWSIGCLIYLMLSRKVPFYQYSQNAEILSALSRGELPARPVLADNDTDKIEDSFWDLITKCCVPKPNRRLTLPDIRKWLGNLGLEDNRPPAKPLPGNEILKLWETHRGVDVEHMRDVLAQIKSQLPPVTQDEEKEDES